ncbi:NADH:ubiquinone reductase (Na(+)-transporting) subunit F [Horticoccus luteus]|uniref:Na(+)-translocating NADH-quinone reductase subunit F n=1 Tax=Horticoccus luteus TaxID=2862869 RepID=A0A8F9TU12_9BACT|nr:NADH:ubiquinone reductase (Na(+)-transporting) subunit F [Horticoccus luteus]QYM78110.1 NADH:ubiquinone reductase (Na(+)-transporting) subunit F [Horticoccus luteus]
MSVETSAASPSAATSPPALDYSLTGVNATRAIELGLAEAEWYQSPVPRDTMRALLERRNGPALRDTLIWFSLLFITAAATYLLWGSWWAVLPYLAYCVLYSQTSDSRWHETSHGTAFKTDWMNNALYEIASFMVKREATLWRWSHTRHHSDTIIVGRDPEINFPRPPDLKGLFLGLFSLHPDYWQRLWLHATGRMRADEKVFVPPTEFGKVYWRARLYLAIYVGSLALSFYWRTPLPALLIIFPNVFGTWLLYVYNLTQHGGLAENVLDHRLNCRTVYMNPVNRFMYWNMNYHVEHHMFPLVPYHRLPQLHALVKDDMPPPYPNILSAWREIIPTVRRQLRDPGYYVRRPLPAPKTHAAAAYPVSTAQPDSAGWLDICPAADLTAANALRFDHGRRTYALYRTADGALFATDGVCTHGNTHLAGGLVIGTQIECPKHNGRFHLHDGSPARPPICRGLATYPIEERAGRLWLNVAHPGGAGARAPKTYRLRVVSNRSVATFIKELVLEPIDAAEKIAFTPGDYLQLDIPAYELIRFREFDIPAPYAAVWEAQHVFDLVARNPQAGRRNNYSLASNQQTERTLRFNVRIATPPPGQDCPPGVGSAYVFNLKPGDTVTAVGPFGDFHLKPTQKEIVCIGGGAGMAPLRAQLSHLFETESTARRVSYWYGARSRQEIFYADYFEQLAAAHPNFTFHLALSSPLPEDNWTTHTGFIHDVVYEQYLRSHPHPQAVEYYLCGPPQMIRACTKMLAALAVPQTQIAFDEF